jgi:hypothetical protein
MVEATATVIVGEVVTSRLNDRRIYGYLIEHLGRVVYGRVYDLASPVANGRLPRRCHRRRGGYRGDGRTLAASEPRVGHHWARRHREHPGRPPLGAASAADISGAAQ